MKVLFTGMASSHCVPRDNVSFFSTIAKAVGSHAEITWATPKMSWSKSDLDKFDLVFFGFIPPTALSANKIYGAMHVLGLMFDSPKLRLVVDGQQIWQYKNSIELVRRNILSLLTRFYSKRAEYLVALDPANREYIDLAAKHFASDFWPKTYYPKLPWTDHARAVKSLGFSSAERLVGVNLDSLLISPEPAGSTDKSYFWSVDNESSVWVKKLGSTLRHPLMPLKTSRLLTDAQAGATIRDSLGAVIAPQDRGVGTWWSYRYIQAMNSNTPVVTDWMDTSRFSSSWSKLAYQIEDMTDSERAQTAKDQLDSYQASLAPKKQTIEAFMADILELNSERI